MTLDDLQQFSRSKADEAQGGYIDSTELIRYINQGYRLVYGKIVQRFEDYFITIGTTGNGGSFTTVSNTMSYALPANLKKLVRVESRGPGETNENLWRRVDRANIQNDSRRDLYSEAWADRLLNFQYFVAGNQIHLRPVPQTGVQVRIWFVPQLTALALAADVPVIPDEFHDMLADYAAIQCLAKSGEGIYSERLSLWNQELQNLIENIEIRDQQPEQMVITENSDTNQFEDPRGI